METIDEYDMVKCERNYDILFLDRDWKCEMTKNAVVDTEYYDK